MSWIETRESLIFTRVSDYVSDALSTKYPNINFTTDDSENVDAKFPNIYMFFDFVERMSTLDGQAINGGIMTIRTKTSVTKAMGNTVAKEVNACVRDALKELCFTASGSPIPTTSRDTKEINATYQRMVGYNDPF